MTATVSAVKTAAPRLPPQGKLDWRALLKWLYEDGWIAADEAKRVALRFGPSASSLHPLVRLGGLGLVRAGTQTPIDAETLSEWLAGRFGLPYLRIDPLKVDVGRVAETMSPAYATARLALPVSVSAHEVTIATAEPFDTAWVAEIEAHTQRKVKLVVANPDEIRRFTTEFYALAKSVRNAVKRGENSSAASFEQLVELGKSNKALDANDQGVVQVVDWLWQYAFDQRASDIHLEPRRELGVIRFRIDGVMHTAYQVPPTVMSAMTARIKLLGRMDVVEKRRPQDGRIKTLRRLATDEVNVCTVEDPIEMIQPAFNQTQVQSAIDLGFAEGLRALMRQDPDIILVGEIRDLETAEMAIQAALTGHLVFSTLHTNDAPSAITRLIDLGVPPYLIGASVIGVLAQRLVRTLCEHCKKPDESVTRETLLEVIKPWRLNGGMRPYKPVGCLDCRMTGFRGRAGLYELLTVSHAAHGCIHPVPDTGKLRAQALLDGLRPLRLAGAMKVAEGVTTIDEVLRSTPQWG